jgi:hypothetical protein
MCTVRSVLRNSHCATLSRLPMPLAISATAKSRCIGIIDSPVTRSTTGLAQHSPGTSLRMSFSHRKSRLWMYVWLAVAVGAAGAPLADRSQRCSRREEQLRRVALLKPPGDRVGDSPRLCVWARRQHLGVEQLDLGAGAFDVGANPRARHSASSATMY